MGYQGRRRSYQEYVIASTNKQQQANVSIHSNSDIWDNLGNTLLDNKLSSLVATLVQNFDPQTDGGEV